MKKITLALLMFGCFLVKSQTIFLSPAAVSGMTTANLFPCVEGNEDTVFVKFQYSDLFSELWFGEDGFLESETVAVPPNDSVSTVFTTISGLEPGRIYYYKAVDSEGNEGPSRFFNTHYPGASLEVNEFELTDECVIKFSFISNVPEPFIGKLKFGDEENGVLIFNIFDYPDGLIGEEEIFIDFSGMVETGINLSDTVKLSFKLIGYDNETIFRLRGFFNIKSKDCEESLFGFRFSEDKYNINIYPNPVKDFIYFNQEDQFSVVEIENLAGTKFIFSKAEMIDVGFLPAGLYWVNLRNPYGAVIYSEKIIKIN